MQCNAGARKTAQAHFLTHLKNEPGSIVERFARFAAMKFAIPLA